jgi:hypothetical protein
MVPFHYFFSIYFNIIWLYFISYSTILFFASLQYCFTLNSSSFDFSYSFLYSMSSETLFNSEIFISFSNLSYSCFDFSSCLFYSSLTNLSFSKWSFLFIPTKSFNTACLFCSVWSCFLWIFKKSWSLFS